MRPKITAGSAFSPTVVLAAAQISAWDALWNGWVRAQRLVRRPPQQLRVAAPPYRARGVPFAGNRLAVYLLRAVVLAALCGTWPSPGAARDLVIFAEPTLKPVLRSLGQMWRARTGMRVDIFGSRT